MSKYINEIMEMKSKGLSDEIIIAWLNAQSNGNDVTVSKSKAKNSTGSKAKSKAKSDNSDFDRELYVECAEALGCYNAKYDKVVATVENGKVIRKASENRKLVYAEMEKRK